MICPVCGDEWNSHGLGGSCLRPMTFEAKSQAFIQRRNRQRLEGQAWARELARNHMARERRIRRDYSV